jgi:hypothetical protein
MSGKGVMVDIETGGDEPAGAAVVAVGAVVFDHDARGWGDEAVWHLDPAWSPGRRNRSTYEFWMRQDPRVREPVFSGSMLPWDFCEAFSEFCSLSGAERYWAWPTRFDFGHLRELYHACGHRFPFEYWKELDAHTLKWAAREKARVLDTNARVADVGQVQQLEGDRLDAAIKRIDDSNASQHDPLADCREQVQKVQLFYRYLRTGEV